MRGFESTLQNRTEEGLRKYINKDWEGQCKQLEIRRVELEAKVDIMQEELYRVKNPSRGTAGVQCKLISSRTLEELSKSQYELD
jgi:hypothetical protein